MPVSRRQLLGTAAVAGVALAGARSATFAAPATGPTVNGVFQNDVEIVYRHIWGTQPGKVANGRTFAEQVVDLFNEKKTGVTVKSVTDGANYQEVLQKTQAELAAGIVPDLVSTPWSLLNWATVGLGLVKLEDVAGDAVQDLLTNLRDDVKPLVTIDGATRGVPYAFSTPIMYYNQDLFDDAGVTADDVLATWDDLTGDAAKQLSDAVGGPIMGMANGGWPSQGVAQSNGGFLIQDGRFVMDSPETIEAMDKVASLGREEMLMLATSKEEDAAFQGGSLPIRYFSVAGLSNIRANTNFNLATVPFPAFAGKPRMMCSGGSFIGMYSRDEEKQQAAWEFLKFMVTEEGYEPWSKMGYLNATVFDFPRVDGQDAAYTQLEEGMTPENPWPTERGAEFANIWYEMVDRIWGGDISAEEGCPQAAAQLNEALGA